MILSYDIARCAGTAYPLCQSCRRTEPGREMWQTNINPAIDTNGCINYIGPKIETKGGTK